MTNSIPKIGREVIWNPKIVFQLSPHFPRKCNIKGGDLNEEPLGSKVGEGCEFRVYIKKNGKAASSSESVWKVAKNNPYRTVLNNQQGFQTLQQFIPSHLPRTHFFLNPNDQNDFQGNVIIQKAISPSRKEKVLAFRSKSGKPIIILLDNCWKRSPVRFHNELKDALRNPEKDQDLSLAFESLIKGTNNFVQTKRNMLDIFGPFSGELNGIQFVQLKNIMLSKEIAGETFVLIDFGLLSDHPGSLFNSFTSHLSFLEGIFKGYEARNLEQLVNIVA